MRCGYDFYVCGIYGVFVGKIRGVMKKYYIGGLLTLVTIAFATVTLAVNKDVIGYRRYIYIHRPQKQVVLCLLLLRYT